MKIIDKSTIKSYRFENLEISDTFEQYDELYMKVSDDDGNNAFKFGKQALVHFEKDAIVDYIQSELILIKKGRELDD